MGAGRKFGFFPNTPSMGNALQVMRVFSQPQVRDRVVQMVDERAEQDEQPQSAAVAHLLRQARKIQRGTFEGTLEARQDG